MQAKGKEKKKRYGTSLSLKDFKSGNYWEVWGGTKEESIEKVCFLLLFYIFIF